MYVLAIDPGARGCGAALFATQDDRREDRSSRLVGAEYVVFSSRPDKDAFLCAVPFSICSWISSRGVDPRAVGSVVLEFPQTYHGRATRGDANDLLLLAFVDGAIAALFPQASVTLLRPVEWKEQVPKPKSASETYIIRSRVEARLQERERASVMWPKNVRHSWDVADALGIGLHHLGRFAPQRGAR